VRPVPIAHTGFVGDHDLGKIFVWNPFQPAAKLAFQNLLFFPGVSLQKALAHAKNRPQPSFQSGSQFPIYS
jgi:hypothetical protein